MTVRVMSALHWLVGYASEFEGYEVTAMLFSLTAISLHAIVYKSDLICESSLCMASLQCSVSNH